MSRIALGVGLLAATALFGCAANLEEPGRWEGEMRVAAQEVAPEPVTVRWGERGSLAEIRNMEITTEVAGGRAEAEALAADIEAAVAPIAVTMPVKGGVYITVNAIDGERKYRHWQQRSFDQLADDYQLPREK